jgi:sialic acid synthase SpsE
MFIIAEIGSNIFKHDKDEMNLEVGFSQIYRAAQCGADAVKFQMFTSKELFGVKVAEVDKCALPREWVPELASKCKDENIEFMCSAFSVEGFDFIDKYVQRHKVASPEVLAADVVTWNVNQLKQVIWSNGCAEVMLREERQNDVVLNCVSAYPAKCQDYNFDPPSKIWGVSDHTPYDDVALRAYSCGATYFEKHVDFLPFIGKETPDKCVSVDGYTFSQYCDKLRNQQDSEENMRAVAAEAYGRKFDGHGWFRPLPEAYR